MVAVFDELCVQILYNYQNVIASGMSGAKYGRSNPVAKPNAISTIKCLIYIIAKMSMTGGLFVLLMGLLRSLMPPHSLLAMTGGLFVLLMGLLNLLMSPHCLFAVTHFNKFLNL